MLDVKEVVAFARLAQEPNHTTRCDVTFEERTLASQGEVKNGVRSLQSRPRFNAAIRKQSELGLEHQKRELEQDLRQLYIQVHELQVRIQRKQQERYNIICKLKRKCFE